MENASITVNSGDRFGLVGRNGAGKTTLLKVLAGEGEPHKGQVRTTGTIGYLPQDPRHGDLSVTASERILSGRNLDEILRGLKRSQEAMGTGSHEERRAATHLYGDLEEKFSALGGYTAESNAEAIATSLGLPERVLTQPLSTLSGGQRRRVELARILFSDAETLLLDEPTNHLDADSILWLRGFLKSHRSGLIIISHDVDLLEETVNKVAYLDANRGVLDIYSMGFKNYLNARSQTEERLRKERQSTESKITTLQRQADKMRGSSSKRARVAKVLDRRAERLVSDIAQVREHDRLAHVTFPDPQSCGRVPLSASGLSKSYGSLEVFTSIDLSIDKGSRVVILGLNGAGKTTLLRILGGVETSDSGIINHGPGAKLGYYAQEHETLDPDATILDNLRRVSPGELGEVPMRSLLGAFLFSGDTAFQKAGTLSGGEKTRLALAMLVVQASNVLLLDEPTNNLDPASRSQVLNALKSYRGAVIMVTHDPGAVEALAPDRVLLLPDGVEDFWKDDLADLITLA